jgi:hypothetical protein
MRKSHIGRMFEMPQDITVVASNCNGEDRGTVRPIVQ